MARYGAGRPLLNNRLNRRVLFVFCLLTAGCSSERDRTAAEQVDLRPYIQNVNRLCVQSPSMTREMFVERTQYEPEDFEEPEDDRYALPKLFIQEHNGVRKYFLDHGEQSSGRSALAGRTGRT